MNNTTTATANSNTAQAGEANGQDANGGTIHKSMSAASLPMFVPSAIVQNGEENEEGNNLDLDDLFRDCYFGDFTVPEGDGISGSLPFIPSTGPPTIPLPPSVSTTVAPTTTPAGTTAPTTTTIVAPAVTTPSPAALNTVPVPVAPTTVAAPTIKSEPTTMPTTTSALPPPPPPPVIAPLVSNNTFYSAQPTPTTMQVPSSSAVTTAKRKAEEALEQATAGTSNAVKPPPSKKLDTSLTPTSASAGANGSAPTKALTDQQKVERRERNRKHAKRSRLRKKFLLESLQEQINGLQDEIESLKDIIKKECPDKADSLLQSINGPRANFTPLPMPSGFGPVKTLMEPDFRLMSALSGSQQNFAISDPSLPDNPIVYVSQGFLELTGYTLDQVLGRNCRFLQGPGTDQSAVDIIRKGVREGVDTSVCLLNYKADGTPFWNQFFVAALRDAENNVVNFVGVQCEVSKAVVEKQMAQKEAEAEKAQKEE